MLVKVLCGSKEARVTELELQNVSTYGIMKDTPRDEVGDMISLLMDLGYISKDEEYGSLWLTDAALKVLYGGERVTAEYKELPPRQPKKKEKTMSVDSDEALYEVLRKLRFALANEQKIPAYLIFSNATLVDMAGKKPTTINEFLQVSGVGEQKAEKYGEAFINAVKEYLK